MSAAETIRQSNADWPLTMVSRENSLPFSPIALPEYIEGKISSEKLFLWDDRFVEKAGINLVLGKTVVSLRPNMKEIMMDDGSVLPYDQLLIASGASPVLPENLVDLQGVFTLRNLADAEAIRCHFKKRVVVYGAGAVAIKVSVALRRVGVDVIVLCRSRVLRRQFDEDICELIHGLLAANGVTLIQIREVPHIIGNPVERVRIGGKEFECDGIVAALGVAPNTSFVDGQTIQLGPSGGVVTSDRMQTSSADVYAAGDCAETKDIISGKRSVAALWLPAVEQGRVAALNMLGQEIAYRGALSQNMIDVFDTPFASIGSLDGEKIGVQDGKTIRRFTLKNGKVIGAQLVGDIDDAGLISLGIRRGIEVTDLEHLKLLSRRYKSLPTAAMAVARRPTSLRPSASWAFSSRIWDTSRRNWKR